MRLTFKFMLVLISLFSASSLASVTHSIGIARSVETDAIQYVEHHQYFEDGSHVARYFDPNLQLLLEKRLAYTGLPQHPEIEQSDFLTQKQVSISVQDAAITMIETRADQEIKKAEFTLSPDIIIDAGFDSYIRSNWDSFVPSDRYNFKLAVAGQKNLLGITLQQQESQATRFVISPQNWLVRLIVPEIELTYDDNRRLDTYRGPANIKLKGAKRDVAIHFDHYELATSLPHPRPEWISAKK